MARFISHAEGVERTLAFIESEAAERRTVTTLILLVDARMLAAELRRVRRQNDQLRQQVDAQDGAHEVQCPSCGATIRARMADQAEE